MDSIYITGGKQYVDKVRPEWHLYEKGMILKLDLSTLKTELVKEWVKPNKTDNESIIFKSGYRENGLVFVCSQTEAIVLSEETLETIKIYSHPYFNDLHHVIPSSNVNNVLVVSTGLDAVFEITPENEIVQEWSTHEGDIWEKFDRNVDYRKVATTKPHLIHPNHICKFKDQLWVTRLATEDAICLNKPGVYHKMLVGKPHDGQLFNHSFCYTTVNGYVLMFDSNTMKLVKKINLNNASGSDKVLGWCRGLHVLNEDEFLVGFTKIRNTKFKANLNWIKKSYYDYSKNLPTRIAAYSISKNKFLYEVNLEKHGLDAVFSIL